MAAQIAAIGSGCDRGDEGGDAAEEGRTDEDVPPPPPPPPPEAWLHAVRLSHAAGRQREERAGSSACE
jgi:hypothetical protein